MVKFVLFILILISSTGGAAGTQLAIASNQDQESFISNIEVKLDLEKTAKLSIRPQDVKTAIDKFYEQNDTFTLSDLEKV